MSNNDSSLLGYMLKYCKQIQETSAEFDNSKDKFDESATFRNAICLCLLQIGELVSVLSDDFKKDNPDMQWKEIKLLRNIVAHRYGQIDYDIIWDICLNDVPEMIDFCIKELSTSVNDGNGEV